MTALPPSADLPLWATEAWFFEAYAALLEAPLQQRAAISARLAGAQDGTQKALALFLAGTFADLTGDGTLVTSRPLVVEAVREALERMMAPTGNGYVETWVLALHVGALRLANLVLGRPDITRLIAPAKNFAFARLTKGGTLMSASDRETLDMSVILAAIPFGLFDPEDLVLVDAVRKLVAKGITDAGEKQMLGWYYAEQGSYGRAREMAAGAAPLAQIARKRLKQIGQLDARFIRHAPEGNGNRYEPMIEERFPKLISANDEVRVTAIAAPLSAEDPVVCVVDGQVIAGTLHDTHWEFVLPAAPAGRRPSYVLRFRDAPEAAIGPFSYEVLERRDGGPVTLRDLPAGVTVDAVSSLVAADGTVKEISLRLRHAPCGFYGLGERYNALDQTGNRVEQFVYNQYKNQGLRTYIPMPVFYTDAQFGAHIVTDNYSWFDFREPGTALLGVEAESLRLDFFSGSVTEQIAGFLGSTGEPEPVPLWALGPWMSSNNWDSQAEVLKQVALTETHQVPATVLVIEAWSDEATFYIFNDATYPPKPGAEAFSYGEFSFPEWGRWPDPKGMVEHLHDHGLKLILWQIPVIRHTPALRHAQKQRDEAHFLAQGFGVRHPDGTALRLPEGWFKDSLLMDFSNEAAKDWWFDKRRYLIDELKVDGFKTDGGEMVWGKDLVFADGQTGLTHRNRYPRDYISAYYRFAQQNGGICFSRAGYTGAQTFPAHWAGDERSTWDAFRRSLLAGLSAGMSGVIFWGWDLAGFSGEVPGAELFIRSAQMACFCPIMQYHAESKAEFNQDRTPWNIAERSGDPSALSGYAFYANLRMQLLPYLEAEAAHCVATRTPLMRAMLLDFESDATARPLWDQYMLGRDLLVAPVITEGAREREVYLPEGSWWHLFEERWYEGGQWQTIAAPLEQIPVFVREGAAIPLWFEDEMRLGARMSSGLDVARRRVTLIAGQPLTA